jgi:hypothetical protein
MLPAGMKERFLIALTAIERIVSLGGEAERRTFKMAAESPMPLDAGAAAR